MVLVMSAKSVSLARTTGTSNAEHPTIPPKSLHTGTALEYPHRTGQDYCCLLLPVACTHFWRYWLLGQ